MGYPTSRVLACACCADKKYTVCPGPVLCLPESTPYSILYPRLLGLSPASCTGTTRALQCSILSLSLSFSVYSGVLLLLLLPALRFLPCSPSPLSTLLYHPLYSLNSTLCILLYSALFSSRTNPAVSITWDRHNRIFSLSLSQSCSSQPSFTFLPFLSSFPLSLLHTLYTIHSLRSLSLYTLSLSTLITLPNSLP